jgi:two-component sensor histidine kinase
VLFKNKRNATLETRVFTGVSAAAGVAALGFVVLSIRLSYSVPIIILSAVSATVYGFFFFWGRRLQSTQRVFYPFIIYSMLVVSALWFGTGGFYSDVPIFFLAILVIFVMISPDERYQRVALVAIALLFIGFAVVQYAAPGLIVNVPTRADLTLANLTTTAILGVVVAVVTGLFKRNQDKDREEIRALMKELTHRVNNNLSLVSSMILLKDNELGDRADLSDLYKRVNTVARMHQRMQRAADASHVRLGSYLGDILKAAFAQSSERTVSVTNEVPDLPISSKTAVVLGLILNEIATNATKYGFGSAEVPEFHLSLAESQGDRYVLNTHENGEPFPEDIDFAKAESTGLQLIRTLSEQIGGTAELRKRPHPSFRITFTVDEE